MKPRISSGGVGRQAGFTLIELVSVMIIVGVLALTALPRLPDKAAFEERGFSDETKALLRYGRESAVAQRRNVCVELRPGGVALRIDVAAACDGELALPAVPVGGVGLASSITGFVFRPAGDTDQTANIVVAISGTTITIDRTTGYVY